MVERDGFVGIITINRPEKLNAMTPEMAAALVAAVNEFNADDGIRCVILTGAGEKAFCAGSDIRHARRLRDAVGFPQPAGLLRRDPGAAEAVDRGGQWLRLRWRARDGDDLRHPHRGDATPALRRRRSSWAGSAAAGMAVNLAHAVGPSNAALMIMTGDPIDAATAERWGLVSRVVPQANCWPRRRRSRRPSRRGRRSRPRRRSSICARRGKCRSPTRSPMSATCRRSALPPTTPRKAARPSRKSARRCSGGGRGRPEGPVGRNISALQLVPPMRPLSFCGGASRR